MRSLCIMEDCLRDTNKGAWGYCGMHYQRVKRYGDPNYITPEVVRRKLSREAQLKVRQARPGVYKKYFGRHEHRVVAEKKIGRRLRTGEIVHHIDGDCHNNKPENLEIMSRADHIRVHYPAMRAAKKCQLTDDEVREIRASSLGGAELHRTGKYPVSVWLIYHVKQGKIYCDVTDEPV